MKILWTFVFGIIATLAMADSNDTAFTYRLDVGIHPKYTNDAALLSIVTYCKNAGVAELDLHHAIDPMPVDEHVRMDTMRYAFDTFCKFQKIEVPIRKATGRRVTISDAREPAPISAFPESLRIAMAQGHSNLLPVIERKFAAGRFRKSLSAEKRAICESAVCGAAGVLFQYSEIFDAGGFSPFEAVELAQIKPYLEYYRKHKVSEKTKMGVDVLVSDGCTESPWLKVLTILGVSTRVVTTPDPKRLTAVGAAALKSMPDAKVAELLKGKILLDGAAAMALVERGQAAALGLDTAAWIGLEESGYAYEVIRENKARMTAQRLDGPILKMSPKKDAVTLSDIHRFTREPLFPGLISYQNKDGGTILTMSYVIGRGQFYMGYFNRFRTDFMQKTIRENAPEQKIAFAREKPLHIYCDNVDAGTLVTIVNPSMDALERVTFAPPVKTAKPLIFTPSMKSPVAFNLTDGKGETITLAHPLPPLSQITILFPNQ